MNLQTVLVGNNGILSSSCITTKNNAILVHYASNGGTCFDHFRGSKAFLEQSFISVISTKLILILIKLALNLSKNLWREYVIFLAIKCLEEYS